MGESLAIVGMACRLPGASDLESYWDLLVNGRTAFGPVPAERWDWTRWHAPEAGTPGRTVLREAGFITDAERFDHAFFGLSRREARAMDPQQRLLLQETWHCLEHAGVSPDALRGGDVGVFVGTMANDWLVRSARQPADAHSCLGTYPSILANRLSHFFGWRGPSVTVDAACASSLVALHQARAALLAGECSWAVVAASSLILDPWRAVSFSQARMYSPTNRCHSFDAAADGYVPGEGVVAVLVRRKADALRDGQRIHGLVLGSAVNHVGPSRSLTAPGVAAQRAVITRAAAEAAVPLSSVSYVEAHGTGTALGDPIEVEALTQAFGRQGTCAVGTVKTNIGHLEAAAGLAGLLKVVLMMKHRMVVATAGLETINPLLDFAAGPFRPVTAAQPWAEETLRAGISSFGFGGANAHVIVEQPPAPRRTRAPGGPGAQPVVLSAATAEDMAALLDLWRGQPVDTPLEDISHTLRSGRAALPWRWGGLARSAEDLPALLATAAPIPLLDQPPRVLLRLGPPAGLDDAAWTTLCKALPALGHAWAEAEAEARHAKLRSSPRLTSLLRLYAAGRLLLDLGLKPALLTAEGVGRWAGLALAGVVTLAEAAEASGSTKTQAPLPRRPEFPVHDSMLDVVIEPCRLGADYLRTLQRQVQAADVAAVLADGWTLAESNRTVRGFLDEWAQGDLAVWRAATDHRVQALAVAAARRRGCDRWGISEPGPALPPALDELASLVVAGFVDAASAVDLVRGGDCDALAAALPLPGRRADPERMPLLAAQADLEELGDPGEWLRSRPGRPRKMPGDGFDLAVDVGHMGSMVDVAVRHVLDLGADLPEGLAELSLDLWLRGGTVAWSVLYGPQRPVDLPLYPFAGEVHRLENVTAPVVEAAPEPLVEVGRLLHRAAWQPLSGTVPAPTRALVLGDRGGMGRALAATMPGARLIEDGFDALPEGETPDAVFVTWGFDLDAQAPTAETVVAAEDDALLPMLALVRALGACGKVVRLVVVGPAQALDAAPFTAALGGIAKTAGREYPDIAPQVLTVPADRSAALACLAGVPTLPGGPLAEVAVTAEGRWRRVLLPAEPAAEEVAFPPSGAVLIAGGLGGIGRLLARQLLRQGRAVALFGRRPMVAAVEDVRDLAAEGGTCIYIEADITDPDSTAAAVAEAARQLGPIGTVIQSTLVLADAALANLDTAAFRAAWRPKALGSVVLEDAVRNQPVRCFVSFSSVTTLRGNGGQGNYVAGGCFQESWSRLNGHRVVQWGYWADAGGTATNAVRARLGRQGIQGMSDAEGMAAFAAAMARPDKDMVAAAFDDALCHRLAGTDTPPPKPLARELAEGFDGADLAAAVRGMDLIDDYAAAVLAAGLGPRGLSVGVAAQALEASFAPLPQWERLCRVMLDVVRRHGWLRDEDGVARLNGDPAAAASALRARLLAEFPWSVPIVDLVDASAPRVADVVCGDMQGTQILFPEGSTDMVAKYYRDHPVADACNRQTALAVRRLAEQAHARHGGTVSILEAGAGTGGTTGPVLAALAESGVPFRYVFSDVSQAFLNRARRRWGAEVPQLEYARFDLEAEPEASAALGRFDIAMATNAVHATRDLDRSLANLAERLNDDGALVLNELTRLQSHLSAVFGVLDGWWLATDGRRDGPLLSLDGWRGKLSQRYEVEAAAGPGGMQAVMVARRRAAVPGSGGLLDTVRALVAEVTGDAVAAEGDDVPFADLGVDSILGLDLVDRLGKSLGLPLGPGVLNDHPTAARLADYLTGRGVVAPVVEPVAVPAVQSSAPAGEPIAIIGMAGRFPGADDLDAFWALLNEGRVALGAVPDGRWSEGELAAFLGDGPRPPLVGGFLADAECFDAGFFSISPREALAMDPQQRLVLEETWKALAHAGLTPSGAGTGMGVFVGASAGDWVVKLPLAGMAADVTSLVGTLPSSMAARLAYAFDFHGPAMTVDLGCASSAAALHLACESLRRGECDKAVAVGVAVQATPMVMAQSARAGLLSPTGRSQPFAVGADGMVLGEAAVAVVLEPLSKALAAGRRVLAVVRSGAVAQEGTTNGISAPSAPAQARLLDRVLRQAGLGPDDVDRLETHGVGTPAGDLAELTALGEVFGQRAAPLSLGAVKANIGHPLAAAGLVAVVRMVLEMQAGRMTPQPGGGSVVRPFVLESQATQWPESGRPRRGVVMSYAVNGGDAALVLEQAPAQQASVAARPSRVFARERYWPGGAQVAASVPVNTDVLDVLRHELAAVLRTTPDRVPPEASPLALGLESIMGMELVQRLRRRLGVEPPVVEVLTAESLTALAGALAGAAQAAPVAVVEPVPGTALEPFPLTDLQMAYWLGRGEGFVLGGNGCHVYWEFVADQPFDLPRLERAWLDLVRLHPMLRAVVDHEGHQRVLADPPPFTIRAHDWRGLPAAQAAESLAAVRERMSHRCYDPANWPLFEVEASQDAEGTRLHFGIDLLIIDVLSLFRLLRQWGRLYADPAALPAVPALGFHDYVRHLQDLERTAEYAAARAWWEARLDTLPPGPRLPLARAPGELGRARYVRRAHRLSPAAWTAFRDHARAAGVTPAQAVMAALAEVLGHWAGEDRFSLNVTVFDRRPVHPDVDQVIGDFTSTLLLAVDTAPGPSFAERGRAVRDRLGEDLRHTLFSGVRVLRKLSAQRPPDDGMPFAPVVFTSMLGYSTEAGGRLTGLGRLDFGVTQTPQVVLDAQVYEEEGALHLTWDTVEALYPSGLIGGMFEAYGALVDHLAAGPDAWGASARAALAAGEAGRRAAANATAGPVPDGLLHEGLLRVALADPDRLAVIAPDRRMTYGDLAAHAAAVAQALRGVQPGELVAVVLEKGWRQVAAVLGVLMAGAAYLPLDPALPRDRLWHLLRRGEVRLALGRGGADWPEGVSSIDMDTLRPLPLLGVPPAVARPEDLAYVMFTSGSTGEPKGVMIDHRGALNTVIDINERFGLTAADRVLGLSALGFDLSVWDIFGTLAVGAALVLPRPHSVSDPDHLAGLVRDEGVTVWNSVPAFLGLALAAEGDFAPLRLVLLSGDWIPLDLPDRLRAVAPNARLISLGGATEASIWSIYHPVDDGPQPGWTSIPYGRALRNQTIHVLDEQFRPLPDWVPGELYIGGIGLSQGYWRDPERTAAAFVHHPATGERLYRTGDMGRTREGGVIEFLGRRDGQVKIGGFRVELGEIEAVAARHPDVGQAVAVAVGDAARRHLVLHVTGRDGAVDAEALGPFLRDRLPAYMVPAHVEVHDRLPLNTNGKIDRAALAGMTAAPVVAVVERHATGGGLADQLAALVAEELGQPAIDPQGNLFELGVDSLIAVALNRRINGSLGRSLGIVSTVTDLFEHPTVERLARHLSQTAPEVLPEIPVTASPSRPADTPPVQDRREARRRFRNLAALQV